MANEINQIKTALEHHTHHAPLAVFLVAEHGLFPLQSSQSAVQVLDQLVSVLQLDQLEGLLSPNAHYDRVGKQAGALRFFYGQHLRRKRRKQGIKAQPISPLTKSRLLVLESLEESTNKSIKVLKYCSYNCVKSYRYRYAI